MSGGPASCGGVEKSIRGVAAAAPAHVPSRAATQAVTVFTR